ncbi:MAG: hypothetical protein GXP35_13025 [Actinobacteria bacterium]|nr:hypothetical protein [Actinomycetota bacterium]
MSRLTAVAVLVVALFSVPGALFASAAFDGGPRHTPLGVIAIVCGVYAALLAALFGPAGVRVCTVPPIRVRLVLVMVCVLASAHAVAAFWIWAFDDDWGLVAYPTAALIGHVHIAQRLAESDP